MEIKHPLYTDDGEWLPGHNESEGGGPEIRRGFYDQIFGLWRRAEEGGGGRPHLPEGSRQAEQRLVVEAGHPVGLGRWEERLREAHVREDENQQGGVGWRATLSGWTRKELMRGS